MKYKVEVIADNSEKWVGNGLTFDTREQADAYASDLYSRWTAVKQTRVVEVVDSPIACLDVRFSNGRIYINTITRG